MQNASCRVIRVSIMTVAALSFMLFEPRLQLSSPLDSTLFSHACAKDGGSKGAKVETGMNQGGSKKGLGQAKGGGNGHIDVIMKGQGSIGGESDSPAWAGSKGGKNGSLNQAEESDRPAWDSSTNTKGAISEDSDRPTWAGVKGGKNGGGGKPTGSGSKKGDLYGDLFVLIRDPITGAAETVTLNIDGVPTELPKVQAYDPTSGELIDGKWVPYDEEGHLVTTEYATAEVEFGRLSVSRSPSKVSEHSLTEALSKLTDPAATVSIDDTTGRLVVTVNGVSTTIDSPLENLALYIEVANLTGTDRTISTDGTNPITYTIPTSVDIDMLKATLLAAAGDKAGTITLDTVMYLNPILEVTDDLSVFTYDRATTYSGEMVTVLVEVEPGVFKPTSVDLYDAVFNSTNDTTSTGAADFATAADDALQVIEFVHDNEVR